MMKPVPLNESPAWIEPSSLHSKRFDASYYDPFLFRAEKCYLEQDNLEWKRLGEESLDIYSFGAYELTTGINFVAPSSNSVPFINITDVKDLSVDLESTRHIDQRSHLLLNKSQCGPETLLLSMSGSIGVVAVVPHNREEYNSNQHLAKVVINRENNDPCFLAAYFSTDVGKASCFREANGAIQKELYLYNIADLPVPRPHKSVQLAIGNKVRAAEKLCNGAEAQFKDAQELLDGSLSWSPGIVDSPISWMWISERELGNRIDYRFNSPRKVNILRYINEKGIPCESMAQVADISAMIGWKGLTTEYYSENGPILIRGVDFERGIIKYDQLVRVERHKYEEQPQIHLQPGDVVITKDGTIGKAMAIPELEEDMCAGSTVARLRPQEEIDPYYLEAIVNHPIVQIQIQGMATGLAQPHITQEWIAELLIPIIPEMEYIGQKIRMHHDSLMRAHRLTKSAIEDVEGLIEDRLNIEECLTQGRQLAEEFGLDRP